MSEELWKPTSNEHHCDEQNYFDDLIRNKQYNSSQAQETFRFFDEDRDGILNKHEFHQLCCQLLSHPMDCLQRDWSKQDTDKVLRLLKYDDGQIDETRFQNCWESWIKPILRPVSALIVVDVQNDFISGSLALKNGPAGEDGEEVVPVINRLLDTVQFEEVVYSYDWHPDNHISFYKNRKLRKFHSSSPVSVEAARLCETVVFEGHNSQPIEQALWPTHCVQNSTGAELHKDLKIVKNHLKAFKGTNPEHDNYSAFNPIAEPNNNTSGEVLATKLRRQGITDLFICGLAFDICVRDTALDARRFGFRTIVIEDACRGLDNESINKTKTSMEDAGCLLVKSNKVGDMVSGILRHPILGIANIAALDDSPSSSKHGN